jgi:hypothetical protein
MVRDRVDDRDGDAIAGDGYRLQLSCLFLGQGYTVASNVAVGSLSYDGANPIYGVKTDVDFHDNQPFMVSLGAMYRFGARQERNRKGQSPSGEGDARPVLGVQQLDVADAGGAARNALDRLHQAQQQIVAGAWSADGVGLGDDQVQHGDPLEAVTHVEDHADRAGLLALALDGEQALRVGLPAHAHANRLAFDHDLRRAVAVDGRLDAFAYPVLAAVEEQQRLELVVVLGRQGRYERDLSRNGCLSPAGPAGGRVGSPYGGFRPLSRFT